MLRDVAVIFQLGPRQLWGREAATKFPRRGCGTLIWYWYRLFQTKA